MTAAFYNKTPCVTFFFFPSLPFSVTPLPHPHPRLTTKHRWATVSTYKLAPANHVSLAADAWKQAGETADEAARVRPPRSDVSSAPIRRRPNCINHPSGGVTVSTLWLVLIQLHCHNSDRWHFAWLAPGLGHTSRGKLLCCEFQTVCCSNFTQPTPLFFLFSPLF